MPAPAFHGMSYTPWSSAAATSPAAHASMANLRALGVDTVALNVFWFQDTTSSLAIAEDPTRYGISIDAARHAIRDIRSHGMAVILKPQVDVRDGSWRGQIRPSRVDRPAWFASYGDFINTWAAVAREEGAIGLSVGTEMNAVQSREAEWRAVIAGARERFGGMLTYSANHDEYESVPFWNALDVIGIDAYFALSRVDRPTLAELRQSWLDLASRIGRWRAARVPDRPVVFMEAGYRSVAGAARRPWDAAASGAPDPHLQADAYDALLSVMTPQPWFGGTMFWSWESDPEAGGPLDTGYTPQNKPAQAVLASHYRRDAGGGGDGVISVVTATG